MPIVFVLPALGGTVLPESETDAIAAMACARWACVKLFTSDSSRYTSDSMGLPMEASVVVSDWGRTMVLDSKVEGGIIAAAAGPSTGAVKADFLTRGAVSISLLCSEPAASDALGQLTETRCPSATEGRG